MSQSSVALKPSEPASAAPLRIAPSSTVAAADEKPRRLTLLRVAISAVVVALLLVADVLTAFRGLAGVLYVPLLVAIATGAPRRHMAGYGLLGALSATVAYAMAFGHSPHAATPAPLLIGLVTVAVTSVLIARLAASREALQGANRQLAFSEFRYRALFEQRRYPFWEQDFRGVFAEFTRLRREGVVSLEDYARTDPGFLRRMSDAIVAISCNDAMVDLLGGKTKADVLGPLTKFKPFNETEAPLLQALYDGVGRLDGPARIVGLDGRPREVWIHGGVYRNDERAGLMTVFFVDLTKRESARKALLLAQAELARASREAAVGALSASIAHELNQPLTAALQSARTSLRHLDGAEADVAAAMAAAELAAQEGARAAEIVQRTRAMVTSRAAREEPLELKALVADSLALVEADLLAASVEVRLATPPAEMSLVADRIALQQVLVNLVTNAIQAMTVCDPADRWLHVDLECGGGEVLIRVRDTGPGLEDGDAERLFDPFFTTKSQGVGIGLAVSRSAVEARGGTLRASSAAGGGAVFECRLPLEREAA